MTRHWPLVIVALVAAAVLTPSELHACPVCFDANDETRLAFLKTALVLTALPLGMVGGTVAWLRKRFRDMEDAGPDSGFDRPKDGPAN